MAMRPQGKADATSTERQLHEEMRQTKRVERERWTPEGEERHVDPLRLRPRLSGLERDRAIEMSQKLPDPEVPEPWNLRHPGTRHFWPLFRWDHLPSDLQDISVLFERLALNLLTMCHDGPELTTALRRLLEAKDCAVRQRVIDRESAR